jgi:hypothetical protein
MFESHFTSAIFIKVSIGNHAYTLIDFDFVELRFAPVLRLPRPHGERRTEFPIYRDELGAAKINLLPLGLG